jgi:putative FmdB family regulatory protein
MPIYTYRCENCGVQFERQQHFDEQPLTWCPECNKKALRKVYLPVGIVFKGSGFYSTDHRSPSGAGRANSSKSETSEKKSETPAKETSPSSSTNSSEKSDK